MAHYRKFLKKGKKAVIEELWNKKHVGQKTNS